MRRTVSSRRTQAEIEQDPVLALLAAAPADDEPLSDDDRRHIAEGWHAYRDGSVVKVEEIEQGCLDAGDETNQGRHPAVEEPVGGTSSRRPPHGN